MIDNERRRRGLAPLLAYGPLVRKERERSHLSPRQLCDRIGMTLAQLSDIERGIQTLSLRRALQMARVFGTRFEEIVALVLQHKVMDAGFVYLHVTVTVAEPTDECATGLRRRG